MDKNTLTRGGAGPAGLPQDTVDLEVDGETVTLTVRAMNRGELLMGGKLGEEGSNQRAMERYILSSCMVDPAMTLEDVDAWMASAPAMEIQPVVAKINTLSGVGEGAQKSAVSDDGDRSDD